MTNRAKKEQNCKKNSEHNKKEFKQVHLAKIFFNFYIFHTQTLAQHHNIQAYFFYCNKIIKNKKILLIQSASRIFAQKLCKTQQNYKNLVETRTNDRYIFASCLVYFFRVFTEPYLGGILLVDGSLVSCPTQYFPRFGVRLPVEISCISRIPRKPNCKQV